MVETLFLQYDRRFLPEDPVCFAHQYSDPGDQEVVAFIAALLAFGNAKAIQGSMRKVLSLMGSHPARFLKGFDPGKSRKAFEGLGHRWVRGGDLSLLFSVLRNILDHHSTLREYFLKGYREEDPDIAPLLDRFARKILSSVGSQKLSRGFRYFFPTPADGSPCKRLTLFLRWMVRPADGIDLGLWKEISPSKLIIPLDTHVYRFARRFHLSRYKTPNWKVAQGVTHFLRTLDPEDPVKYDFAICHYGMEQGW